MSFTYLLIDFFTIIVPFIYSFHPKLQFYKTWRAFFPAVLITGLIFILWDVYFTGLGVWGFNPRYLVGIMVGNMPLEEILFFLCIPYACVFTFHCLDLWIKNGISKTVEGLLTPAFIVIFMVIAVTYHDKIYPMVTFAGLSLLLILAKYVLKISWLAKFYVIYSILLIPFLIVNGMLTGTGLEEPVVWYNAQKIIGFRILTIPIEDTFYGMGLILSNLMIYKYLKKRSHH
ncbi:lycopene cyclase domain-containing protein [Pedobacter sp. MC2016-24]|uniref:lycopene cyclase domain-containing protein n=1 Tax=Pedobacter sp. MC2016-24 TaxID=2780090 RepID=UPI00187E7C92|nr:lycopene cyclase domain-containing protein [Pedobacter sp. MC2016-24]MBE9602312.1 lycopene cyclase domain-containing protein [Pedobacter sp. MC2016-24]